MQNSIVIGYTYNTKRVLQKRTRFIFKVSQSYSSLLVISKIKLSSLNSIKMKETELIINSVLTNWKLQTTRASDFFQNLPLELFYKEIAPDRNTGLYLLGHLTSIHDALLPLLELGERIYPELDVIFVKNNDKSKLEKPSPEYLKIAWENVNNKINQEIFSLTVSDWLEKHNSISSEDFKLEPHRNKLNVLNNRASHLAYHLGQLGLLK